MLKLNYRVAGGGCMTIYELNDKLELSNGRARKEVSKNEVIIVNMMMLGLICKYIQKENYSKLARDLQMSEKRLQSLRNGVDTSGSSTVLDKETFNRIGKKFRIAVSDLQNGNEIWCRDGSEKLTIQYRRLLCLYQLSKSTWISEDYLSGLFVGKEYDLLLKGSKSIQARKRANKRKADADEAERAFLKKLKEIEGTLIEQLREDYEHTAGMDREGEREYNRVLNYFKFGDGKSSMQQWVREETVRMSKWDYEALKEVDGEPLRNYLTELRRQQTFVQALLLLPDKRKK